MAKPVRRWRRWVATCPFLLASLGGQEPGGAAGSLGPGELRIETDAATGLPAAIVSRRGGRERSWLAGPVRLALTDEASGKPASGVAWEHRLRVGDRRALWELTLAGDGPRTGHVVRLELPLLFPGARIFTPSQYGVMEVDAYPAFAPVAYATYGWNDGQAYVLPLVGVLDPAGGSGLTLALPADENIPHLQVSWADARVLRLEMGHRGVGGGRPTTVRLLVYSHAAEWRAALAAYAADFPAWFRPPLPRGPYEGAFWYHHIHDHPDFGEMARQGVRYLWSSFWFTHMGEFLPAADEWHPYTYARWWRLGQRMSDGTIGAFLRELHCHGIGTYAYFNFTEYGGAGGERGDTAEADRVLRERLGPALVRNAAGSNIPTWEGSWVINPARDLPYRAVLVEQIRRHLARLPELDGFAVDRLDWASGFDHGRDDGLSMIGVKPVENLAVPVADALGNLCRLAHEAGKRVFVNQFWRVELVRDTDGYCHENDFLPALAYLAPFRPASAWHERVGYTGDLAAFEAQLKRRLKWALLPQMIAHDFPIAQQAPDPRAADLMELFAPLFAPFLGKEQVLEPGCVAVTGPNEADLYRNGEGRYVAPITSRVRFLSRPPRALAPAELTLAALDAGDLAWAQVLSADVPPHRAALETRGGVAVIRLPRHGTSSVVLAGKGPEPPLPDGTRLEALRRRLFPEEGGGGSASGPPDLKEVAGAELEVAGLPVGSTFPAAVVDLLVDGRLAGRLRDAQGWARVAVDLADRPPVVGLIPGDEGTWLLPERVDLIAATKAGRRLRVASWKPGDPCGALGGHGVELPLSWREPEPVPAATARFEARDAATKGSWAGRYGRLASWLPGARTGGGRQSGFALQVAKGREHIWAWRVRGDGRVPEDPSGPGAARRAACWFDPDEVAVRVAPGDGAPYRLTVHVLDFDRAGRAGKVAAEDGREVLDGQQVAVAETGDGIYLTWLAAGPLVVAFRRAAGANAVFSGVFVDRP